jgi:branched-chain amino acid transport system permease protein
MTPDGKPSYMKKFLGNPQVWLVMLFAAFPFIPNLGGYISMGTEIIIWCLFAMGFNILLGYTGLPSFGHGAYFGIGAYGVGIVFTHFEKGFVVPFVLGTLLGTLFAACVGLIIAKKRGIYFALLTIAFSQMFYFIAFRWDEVTGGETGISGIDRMPIQIGSFISIDLTSSTQYYYFVLAIFVLSMILIRRIVHSPFGRVLQGIRENELRTGFLGYNTTVYKWASFAISGFFASLAGSLHVMLQNAAFPEILEWIKSGDVVMMVLLGGGLVNFYGSILGAAIFIIFRDLLSHWWESWLLLYGLLFVFIILFMPAGILGTLGGGRKRDVLK